jgi:hypothetical protein
MRTLVIAASHAQGAIAQLFPFPYPTQAPTPVPTVRCAQRYACRHSHLCCVCDAAESDACARTYVVRLRVLMRACVGTNTGAADDPGTSSYFTAHT